MLKLGLTGSLASGKSTTAAMFAQAGVAVFSADDAVHALYRGAAVPLIETAFPGASANGEVDRIRLAEIVTRDPAALQKLEAIIHPLVRAEEERFLAEAAATGGRISLSDIPLLFETAATDRYDAVVVATAPEDVRRARALARPGMTAARYDVLLARQMPDAEKRSRAHFVIDTGAGTEPARRAVADILRALAAGRGG